MARVLYVVKLEGNCYVVVAKDDDEALLLILRHPEYYGGYCPVLEDAIANCTKVKFDQCTSKVVSAISINN